MTLTGHGPVAKRFTHTTQVCSTGFGDMDMTARSALMFIYAHFANGPYNEVYLRGPSLLAPLDAISPHGFLLRRERALFTRSLLWAYQTNRLQARGPQAWAIAYECFGFSTVPGELPPREWIFERDQWSCQYCSACLRENTAHLDHVFPKSRGGWDDAANVVAACESCNCSKGARTPAEWAAACPGRGRLL